METILILSGDKKDLLSFFPLSKYDVPTQLSHSSEIIQGKFEAYLSFPYGSSLCQINDYCIRFDNIGYIENQIYICPNHVVHLLAKIDKWVSENPYNPQNDFPFQQYVCLHKIRINGNSKKTRDVLKPDFHKFSTLLSQFNQFSPSLF